MAANIEEINEQEVQVKVDDLPETTVQKKKFPKHTYRKHHLQVEDDDDQEDVITQEQLKLENSVQVLEDINEQAEQAEEPKV